MHLIQDGAVWTRQTLHDVHNSVREERYDRHSA